MRNNKSSLPGLIYDFRLPPLPVNFSSKYERRVRATLSQKAPECISEHLKFEKIFTPTKCPGNCWTLAMPLQHCLYACILVDWLSYLEYQVEKYTFTSGGLPKLSHVQTWGLFHAHEYFTGSRGVMHCSSKMKNTWTLMLMVALSRCWHYLKVFSLYY